MNPSISGLLRGIALAVATAAIDATITWMSGSDFATVAPALLPLQPVLVLVLRGVEGAIDHARQQSNPAVGA